MIKKWCQFNENVIYDKNEAKVVFNVYLNSLDFYSNENISKLNRISDRIISIVEEESGSLVYNKFRNKTLIMNRGGVLTQNTDGGLFDYLDLRDKFLEGFVPGFAIEFKSIVIDDINIKRYQRYIKSILDDILLEEEKGIYGDISISSWRTSWVYNITLGLVDFEFKDPFKKENVIDFLEKHNDLINKLYRYADPEEIYQWVKNNDLYNKLSGQIALDFKKRYKKETNPSRYDMESNSQMYIFVAYPKFRENSDGSFKKDIEIEKLIPIDPYDSKYSEILSMLKIRSRIQSGEVYCIWLPKDIEEGDLGDINGDEMEYMRVLIDEKKEKI